MDGIIERLGDKILENARKAAAEKDLPVFERLVKTIMAMNAGEAENTRPSEEIMDYIHQPQNALMHQKIRKLVITGVPPILADIIKDGIEEGVFQTPWPLETMEMIVTYVNTLFDEGLMDLEGEEMMGRSFGSEGDYGPAVSGLNPDTLPPHGHRLFRQCHPGRD